MNKKSSRLPLPTEQQLERAARMLYEKSRSETGFSPTAYTKEVIDIFLNAGVRRFVFKEVDKPVRELTFYEVNTFVVDFMDFYRV